MPDSAPAWLSPAYWARVPNSDGLNPEPPPSIPNCERTVPDEPPPRRDSAHEHPTQIAALLRRASRRALGNALPEPTASQGADRFPNSACTVLIGRGGKHLTDSAMKFGLRHLIPATTGELLHQAIQHYCLLLLSARPLRLRSLASTHKFHTASDHELPAHIRVIDTPMRPLSHHRWRMSIP